MGNCYFSFYLSYTAFVSIYCSERDKETDRDTSLPTMFVCFLFVLDGVIFLLLKKTLLQHIGWKERKRDRQRDRDRQREVAATNIICNVWFYRRQCS